MGLESASYVQDLVATNPLNTDKRERGDDHLRLIKAAAKASLPEDLRNVSGAAVDDVLIFTAANGGGFANVTKAAFMASLFPTIVLNAPADFTVTSSGTAVTWSGVLQDTTGTLTASFSTFVVPWTVASGTKTPFIEVEVLARFAPAVSEDFLIVSLFDNGVNVAGRTISADLGLGWDVVFKYRLRDHTAANSLYLHLASLSNSIDIYDVQIRLSLVQ